MYHSPPSFFRSSSGSVGYYAFEKPRNLIIFIHGFSGKATDTWNDFSTIISDDYDFSKSDILYYGYDSFNGQVSDQSRDFYQFLNNNSIPRRPTGFEEIKEYEKILVVGHSLGAIVARMAVIEAVANQCAWRANCRLLFFAPAHNGARIQNIVFSLPSVFKILGGVALYRKPVLDDLRPGSVALLSLKQRVIDYGSTQERDLLSASVAEAYGDKVVHGGLFCYDNFPLQTSIKNKSHVTVCKPRKPTYMLPIKIIKDAIL